MKPALEIDAPFGGANRVPFAPLADRYSVVGKLRGTGRAEVSLGLPGGARGIDELVVIKAYRSERGELGAGRDRSGSDRASVAAVDAPPEVEVASTPPHDNLARVFECGWDPGGHFIVSEYLEGTTLRRLLRWLSERGERLPNAAVARILVGMFAAVEHANHWGRTPQARALVHQPMAASDLFITYAGDIKVLGFKPARDHEPGGDPTASEGTAVDELLSTQRNAELVAVLARIGNRASPASLIGLWQVARMLRHWQQTELQSDGAAELAAVLARVRPEARAARRVQLEAAVARVVRARDDADRASDAPPVSGYRVAASLRAVEIVRSAPARPPEIPGPALVVRGAEVTSHLPPVAQRPPGTASPAPRRRTLPWASLVVMAGVLAAGLVVARNRVASVDRLAATPLGVAATGEERTVAAAVGMRADPTAAAAERAAPPLVNSRAPGATATLEVHSTAMHASADDARASLASAPSEPAAAAKRQSTIPLRRNVRGVRRASATIVRTPPPAVAPGHLTLDSTPWSTVSAAGVPLGQTPLVRVALPPGQHLLELENDELGIATSILVEITSGTTTVRRIGLERPIHAARR